MNQQSMTINHQISCQKPILSVRNLCTYFSNHSPLGTPTTTHRAVHNVSFDIGEGQTLGLVGESGCGKTTLVRSILRLQQATGGQVLFNGEDIFRYNQRQLLDFRRQVQIVFQDPMSSLNPSLTIGEILRDPLDVYRQGNFREKKEKAAALLKQVGLSPDMVSRYPHEFSGGQRQRINIARALILQPKILICDEPVSALDVSIRAQILNLLLDLKSNLGLTYIFITHNLSIVENMSDILAVMCAGEIVEIGPIRKILDQPNHPYTQSLLDSTPVLDLAGI